MAKPPECKNCKHAHWSYEPHVWDDTPVSNSVSNKPKTGDVSNKPVSNTRKSVSNEKPVSNKVGTLPRVQTWRNNNREKYNDYMREYMRKKRAVV